MSDYLWDKTGEAEEDVERLEELLGQLRFQPRTFEVPAIMPVAPRRTIARNSFTWSRLAVAASLLLMLLAGAWLVATRQRTNGTQQIAGAPSNGATTNHAQQPTPQQQGRDQLAGVPTNSNETTAIEGSQQREAVEPTSAPHVSRHQRREFNYVAQKHNAATPRQSNVRDMNAPREEIAMTPREREAMEKFLLAMRVTSEKLNYAERQVASVNR